MIVVMARNSPAEVMVVMHRLSIIRKQQFNGPHRAMVRPTKRVPIAATEGGWKTPLQAVLVKWHLILSTITGSSPKHDVC